MRVINAAVYSVSLVATLGCAATNNFDASRAQATDQAPVAAQVEVATLPYDPNLPTFVVAVMPLDYSASGQISGGGQAAPAGTPSATGSTTYSVDPNTGNVTVQASSDVGPNIGRGISAQLITALTRWGNVSVVDADGITRNADGTYTTRMQPGEVGPFVIRGTVTEFSETAQSSGSGRRVSGGALGLAAAVGGALTGNRGLTTAGSAVAIANPTVENQQMERTGMIGMDLQLIDGRTARIVRGYNCSGSFTTMSATSGVSVFGIGGSDSEFAASALGQATRAAMNDALNQTAEALRTAAR